MSLVPLTCLIAGCILLLLGRKAFWLFLSLAVFAVTVTFVQHYLPSLDQRTVVVLSLIAGFVAAVASVMLAKALVWIGGFVGGGYVGVIAWGTLVPAGPAFPWPAFVVGGIAGMLVAKFLFETLLVLASSAVGAALLVHVLGIEGTPALIVLVVLTAAGVIIQGKLLPGKTSGAALPKEEHDRTE
jgi:hypothetical protein